MGSMNRVQLAEFLKDRRARVGPAEAGLPVGVRRRTPGLRREEVAQLAGISVDYYARLEQGRGPHPSRQVLSALGRALRLFEDERAYLFRLAGEQPGPPAGASRVVPAGIMHLLERLDDTPAFVIDAKYDLLAWNQMAIRLMGEPPAERNMIWNAFCGPMPIGPGASAEFRSFADESVADLRAASVRYPDDEGIRALIERLHAASPEFTRRWNQHHVCVRRTTVKTLPHPQYGDLELECQVLHADDSGQRVVFYTAAPGSRTADVLCGLRERAGV